MWKLMSPQWPNLIALALMIWAAFYGKTSQTRKRVIITSSLSAIALVLVYSWQWGIDYLSLTGVNLGDAVALVTVLALFFSAVLGAVHFGLKLGLPRARAVALVAGTGLLVTMASPVLGIYISCLVGQDCL